MERTCTGDLNRKAFIEFLEDHQTEFLNDWKTALIVGETDKYKDEITINGKQMYSLMLSMIRGTLSESDLKELAYKVAKERLEADINIGDFIYNVNLGRSIIINHAFQANVSLKKLQAFVEDINKQFDLFCYHAVSRYTFLKNQELEEKNLFITENHKDKLAILGQISSSFVHEFRNPLTAVIGFNKLLKDEHPNLQYLDIIGHELEQLNFRITQFLHTSKAEINDKKSETISIPEVLNEIYPLIYPSIIDIDVNLTTEIEGQLLISTNKDELKQVLLNLFINSLDALKQKDKPRNLIVHCFLQNTNVVMEISNNGPAIAPEWIDSIFEPFFTTKELGTGIGLFVCKKIIDKQGGKITCESSNDQTTFRIVLPAEPAAERK